MICRILSISALLGLAACQTAPQPAVLTDGTSETMAAVTGVLAGAMNRAQVELGPGDLTQASVISVLPPKPGPLEGNSTALPAVFDLVLLDGDCYVQSRQNGELYLLIGVECRSAGAR